MAQALPQIDWFKYYPEFAVKMVEATIKEIVLERNKYPFKPIQNKF